jgi:hypothetical protein
MHSMQLLIDQPRRDQQEGQTLAVVPAGQAHWMSKIRAALDAGHLPD